MACIAEVLRRAGRSPAAMSRLGFYVLAPRMQIEKGLSQTTMRREAIQEKVEQRVRAYDGDKDA